MSKVAIYPTLEEAYYLHKKLIDTFGGSHGVRDPGLLESALVRPHSGYYETVYEQAAALMQSLARNHPFIDGNKRVAFALTAVFLRINGYKLNVAADEGERFLISEVIQEKIEIGQMAEWLAKHSKKGRD